MFVLFCWLSDDFTDQFNKVSLLWYGILQSYVDAINSAVKVVTGTNNSIKDVNEITWNKVFDIEDKSY